MDFLATYENTYANIQKMWMPPPNLKGSEWADKYYWISPEVGTGILERWKCLPYQVGILDAMTDPEIPVVCVKKSSRVGYTLMFGAALGCSIHNNPRNAAVVQPTISDMEDWSKDFLDSMLRDVPVLRDLAPPQKSRNKNNTILRKKFPGMKLYMIGADSPRGFRRMNAANIFIDEYSGFSPSAGKEGEQLFLLMRRQEAHLNPKMIVGSTPTVAGECKISDLFEQSDKRYYHVPCPLCGFMQYFKWGNIDYSKLGTMQNPVYICEDCRKAIEYEHHRWMIERGEWRATAPYNGVAGFFMWSAYSYNANATWAHLVDAHIKAGKDPIKRRTWVNTWLGEEWIEGHRESVEVQAEAVFARREDYVKIPADAGLITAAGDTQDDRVEILVKAWGKNEESYDIEKVVFIGDPASKKFWQSIDVFLLKEYEHETGTRMRISATGIDSGGHHTQGVYDFCRGKENRGIYAVKGHNVHGKPVIMPPVKDSRAGYDIYMVGTYAAKDIVSSRLKMEEPGPGYIHMNMTFDIEHCRQMFGEVKNVKMSRGARVVSWDPAYPRNEGFDLEIYNLGIERLLFPDMSVLNAYIDSVLNNKPFGGNQGRSYRSRGIHDES